MFFIDTETAMSLTNKLVEDLALNLIRDLPGLMIPRSLFILIVELLLVNDSDFDPPSTLMLCLRVSYL